MVILFSIPVFFSYEFSLYFLQPFFLYNWSLLDSITISILVQCRYPLFFSSYIYILCFPSPKILLIIFLSFLLSVSCALLLKPVILIQVNTVGVYLFALLSLVSISFSSSISLLLFSLSPLTCPKYINSPPPQILFPQIHSHL